VFQKGVLRRIFGQKRDELTGGWRELHNEDLHNLYALTSIIVVIKSKRMIRVVHVARMGRGEEKFLYDFGGRIILEWT
jgi:hypothetical protein